MKKLRYIYAFTGLCLLLLSITSCGSKNGSEIDAGLNDSVNAKYKDNQELQLINKKILDNPSLDSLYRERALVYIKLKDFELAEGDAHRALKLDSLNAKNYILLTDVYYTINETRKAKETLELCLKKVPKDRDALLKMAELFFYVKNYQESINHINKALEVDPYVAKGYFLKGMNYLEIGDTGKAVSSMLTAIEQDGNYYTAQIQLGMIHYYKSDPLCLDYFDNALRINPRSTEALYAKGKFFQDFGKTKEAKDFYNQALAIDPGHKNSLYNIGAIMLSMEKNPAGAKEFFTKAAETDANYTEAWFAKGVCEEQLKNREEAIKNYKYALKLKPDFEPAISALNKLDKKK